MESVIEKLGKVSVTVEKDYHSSEKEYNKLTIVEEQGTFKTYISRKPVPVGIALTNREYWIPFSGVLESITFDYLKFKQEYGSGERLEDNSIKTRHIENGAIEIEKLSTNVRNVIKAANTVVFTGATVEEETEMLVMNRVDGETLVLDEVDGTLPGDITKVSQLENDKGYLTGEVAEESIILNNY